jgi:hypothetical protein
MENCSEGQFQTVFQSFTLFCLSASRLDLVGCCSNCLRYIKTTQACWLYAQTTSQLRDFDVQAVARVWIVLRLLSLLNLSQAGNFWPVSSPVFELKAFSIISSHATVVVTCTVIASHTVVMFHVYLYWPKLVDTNSRVLFSLEFSFLLQKRTFLPPSTICLHAPQVIGLQLCVLVLNT